MPPLLKLLSGIGAMDRGRYRMGLRAPRERQFWAFGYVVKEPGMKMSLGDG